MDIFFHIFIYKILDIWGYVCYRICLLLTNLDMCAMWIWG
jgi:hypothetical protein